jgi:hypothetical protein
MNQVLGITFWHPSDAPKEQSLLPITRTFVLQEAKAQMHC